MPRTPSYVRAAKHVTPEETPGDFAFTGQPSIAIYKGRFSLRSPACSSRSGRAAKAYAAALKENRQKQTEQCADLREPVAVEKLVDALEGMRLTVIASNVDVDIDNHLFEQPSASLSAVAQSVRQDVRTRQRGPAPC